MNKGKLGKRMSANGLISQALGLQASYFVLKEKSKEVRLIQLDRKLLIIAGLEQSASIILSFALEIALKGLLMFRFNDFPKIHNIQKLYNELNSNDRVELAKLYKERTNANIENCLERHQELFIEFRYLESEVNEPNNNTNNVDDALSSII